MREFDWKEETLCSNNLQVKHDLQQLKKKLKKLGVVDEEIYSHINEGLEVLRVMKKQGQAMENRLYAYVKAITSLSFVRVRKGKKKSWEK